MHFRTKVTHFSRELSLGIVIRFLEGEPSSNFQNGRKIQDDRRENDQY